jgi:DNA-binding transcriptional MocR family regulator
VVLNECIELAKEFGGTDGHKYVNGVLNGLAPQLRAAEVEADRASARRADEDLAPRRAHRALLRDGGGQGRRSSRASGAQRQPMIFLNIGEPDFTAPPLVQEAAERAIRDGRTQYTHATGLDALRERISGWYAERFGVTCRRGASSSPPAPRPPCSWPAWR